MNADSALETVPSVREADARGAFVRWMMICGEREQMLERVAYLCQHEEAEIARQTSHNLHVLSRSHGCCVSDA